MFSLPKYLLPLSLSICLSVCQLGLNCGRPTINNEQRAVIDRFWDIGDICRTSPDKQVEVRDATGVLHLCPVHLRNYTLVQSYQKFEEYIGIDKSLPEPGKE